MSRLLLLLAVLPLLQASSCSSPSGETPTKPTGLKIQGAYPAFPTDENPYDYVLFDPDWPVSLRLDLNQTAVADEITLQFWPPPEAGWSKRASSTSGLFWIDGFTPAPSTGFQRILIDGPRFAHPWLWEFLVQRNVDPNKGLLLVSTFQHHLDGPSPKWALMLFYDAASAQSLSSPQQLFALHAATCVLAIHHAGNSSEDRYTEMANGLVAGTFYTMAVILDTSGDGLYDPQTDWWGTASTSTAGWRPNFEQAFSDPLAAPIQPLEAELRRPPAY